MLFLGMFAIGMIGVAVAPHPFDLFLDAWQRGASYAAFFLALTTLRDAAETSPLAGALRPPSRSRSRPDGATPR